MRIMGMGDGKRGAEDKVANVFSQRRAQRALIGIIDKLLSSKTGISS